jgi:hypothetical protein
MSFIERPEGGAENQEKRRYEYRDAEGRKIADVEAEYLSSGDMVEDPTNGEIVTAKRLKKLVLTNPEDGRSFDVLAAFNGSATDVIVPDKRIMNSSHGVMSVEVTAPAPESPVDLGTLLHELGHIDQFNDPETSSYASFSAISKPFMVDGELHRLGLDDAQRLHAAKGHLTAVFAALPEAREAADPAAVAAFEGASTMEELEPAAKRLRDTLALPVRMAERDATRRALLGLRRIRAEAGIDLLSKTINPKEALLSGEEGCEASTAEGFEDPDRYVAVSTHQVMRNDLKMYGAERFRIGRPKA